MDNAEARRALQQLVEACVYMQSKAHHVSRQFEHHIHQSVYSGWCTQVRAAKELLSEASEDSTNGC